LLSLVLAGLGAASGGVRAEGGPLALGFLMNVRCADAVAARLAAWEASGESFEDVGPMPGTQTWRLSTRQFGVWVVAHVDQHHHAMLERVDSREVHRVVFHHSCASETMRADRPDEPAGSAWADRDLGTLLQETGTGLLFVWSPHMPLSVDAYHHAARAAAAEGIAMTVLLHPDADAEYARVTASFGRLPAAALRSFRSIELSMRNATIHAPSVFIYRDGRLSGLALPGYRNEASYRVLIRSRLESHGNAGQPLASREDD
jgi:hypothetical protein